MNNPNLTLLNAKVDELATTLKVASLEDCTCYTDPEQSCRHCNLMTKADRIYNEFTETGPSANDPADE
jgi:hypothetical protein